MFREAPRPRVPCPASTDPSRGERRETSARCPAGRRRRARQRAHARIRSPLVGQTPELRTGSIRSGARPQMQSCLTPTDPTESCDRRLQAIYRRLSAAQRQPSQLPGRRDCDLRGSHPSRYNPVDHVPGNQVPYRPSPPRLESSKHPSDCHRPSPRTKFRKKSQKVRGWAKKFPIILVERVAIANLLSTTPSTSHPTSPPPTRPSLLIYLPRRGHQYERHRAVVQARRSEPPQRPEVHRPQDRRRQGTRPFQCRQAWNAGEDRDPARRGHRRLPGPHGRLDERPEAGR